MKGDWGLLYTLSYKINQNRIINSTYFQKDVECSTELLWAEKNTFQGHEL